MSESEIGPKPNGVLIFAGMQVGVKPGDLTIQVDENASQNNHLILATSYNILPQWLRIARDHTLAAHAAREKLIESWHSSNDSEKRELLLGELRPSIQAIVCMAVAIDGLYDISKEAAKIDQATRSTWKTKRTSRASQVTEIIRRAFTLNNDDFKEVRALVKEIFDLRDKAVHPSSEFKQSVARNGIPVGLDWRFAAYRARNAATALNNCIGLFGLVVDRGANDRHLQTQLDFMKSALQENGMMKSEQKLKPVILQFSRMEQKKQ